MFSHRIPVFKLFGFQVWIDWSWLLIAVLLAWSLADGVFPQMVKNLPLVDYWAMGVAGTIGLFLSIVLHEFAHSAVARKRGLPMAGITLFIFGGVAEMSDEPATPATEFWMAIAGPATSIVIGLACLGIGTVLHTQQIVRSIFLYLGSINL